MVTMNLKAGSSLERTVDVRKQVDTIVRGINGVKSVIAVDGYNVITSSMDGSAGTMFVTLDPWEEREKPHLRIEHIIKQVFVKTAQISDAKVAAFNMPGISGPVVEALYKRGERWLAGGPANE